MNLWAYDHIIACFFGLKFPLRHNHCIIYGLTPEKLRRNVKSWVIKFFATSKKLIIFLIPDTKRRKNIFYMFLGAQDAVVKLHKDNSNFIILSWNEAKENWASATMSKWICINVFNELLYVCRGRVKMNLN